MNPQASERVEARAPWSRLASPSAATVIGGLVAVLIVIGPFIAARANQSVASDLGEAPVTASFGLVGLVVARRQPRNLMGWMLLGIAVGFPLNDDASRYLVLDYRLHGGDLPLGRLAALLQPAWAPAVMFSGLAVLLFPDGRPPANRLRWVMWAFLAIGGLWMVGAYGIVAAAVIGHNIHIVPSGDLTVIDHPSGASAWWGWVQDVFFPVLGATYLLWWVWQIRSYRGAGGERRLQLKWLLSGAAIFALSLPVLLLSSDKPEGIWHVISGAALFGLAALPISIGIGILKFRLYEIDRLISRTISYALLTTVLVATFAAIVTLATRVLPFSSPVAVAASTLAAAALFNPLRVRLQHLVDRRFNRARYDADSIVTLFTARLQDAVDLDTVRVELLQAAAAVQPAHAAIWIRPRAAREGVA